MEEMGVEWVKRQKWRTLRMNCLYYIDQRWKKDHPQHGLFTGLHLKYAHHVRPSLGSTNGIQTNS